MKLIFIYDRLSFNKWFAPLVDEGLARGYDVKCYLNHSDISQTSKWYEYPDEAQMPAFQNGAPRYFPFKSTTELGELLAADGPAVVFCMRPPNALTKPAGQIWAHVVSSFFDSVIAVPAADLERFDLIFCNTRYWIEACQEYFVKAGLAESGAESLRRLQKKMLPTGTTQYDHFSLCDRTKTRKELGIPDGVKVVTVYVFDTSATFWSQRIFHVPRLLTRLFYWIFMPFSYPYVFSSLGKKNIFSLLWKSLARRPKYLLAALTDPSELQVLRKIRAFCDHNNCFLVFKYRKKSPAKWFQANFADLCIYEDTGFFPYSSAQVITASDLLITFYSSSVGESAFAGIPAVSLFPDRDEFFYEDNYLLLHRKNAAAMAKAEEDLYYNRREGGVFNFPGIVNGMTLKEFCAASEAELQKCFQVDAEARQRYVQKYIQAGDGPNAPEILNEAIRRFSDMSENA